MNVIIIAMLIDKSTEKNVIFLHMPLFVCVVESEDTQGTFIVINKKSLYIWTYLYQSKLN